MRELIVHRRCKNPTSPEPRDHEVYLLWPVATAVGAAGTVGGQDRPQGTLVPDGVAAEPIDATKTA